MAFSPAIRATAVAVFALLSALGLYHMRIAPTRLGAPIGFEDIMKNGHLNIPFQHVKLPSKFTGWKPFDIGLQTLIAAFAHGALRLDEDAYWQQLHFLIGFFPVIAIMTIEANRERNRSRMLSYTSIWALFYQTVAGAAIIPLYHLLYILTSSEDGYLRRGRSVPYSTARALFPALVLGYLLPTVLLYLPWLEETPKLYMIATWQFSPILVNVLVSIFGRVFAAIDSVDKHAPNADTGSLTLVYFVSWLAAVVSHCITMKQLLFDNTAIVSFSSVFLPSQSRLLKSTGQDLHNFFQWDWIFIGVSTILWASYALYEARAERESLGLKSEDMQTTPIHAIGHIMLGGPGAMLAASCWERENALVLVEQNTETNEARHALEQKAKSQ